MDRPGQARPRGGDHRTRSTRRSIDEIWREPCPPTTHRRGSCATTDPKEGQVRAKESDLAARRHLGACQRPTALNLYIETSALVKLFLDEAGADEARELWDQADIVSVGRIAYPEARAAFAAAQRAGRITRGELNEMKGRLARAWAQAHVVELDEPVSLAAGDVAEQFALRGFDAVHLATALALLDESLVVATWDAELRKAALDLGLPVAPPG